MRLHFRGVPVGIILEHCNYWKLILDNRLKKQVFKKEHSRIISGLEISKLEYLKSKTLIF